MPPKHNSRKRHDPPRFDEFCREVFQDTVPRRYDGFYRQPALATAVGLGVGLLLSGLPYGGVVGAAALAAGYGALTARKRRTSPKGFDLGSVEPYVSRLREQIPPSSMKVLDEAIGQCTELGYQVALYRIECVCFRHECVCEGRVRAAVAPLSRTYAIMAVGDLLLSDDRTDELRFVLEHELGHLSGARRWSQVGWRTAETLGFALAGLAFPGVAVIAAFMVMRLLCSTWFLLNELFCDLRAARHAGHGAANYWSRRIDHARRARAAEPWWLRVTAIPVRLLPTHPPFRVRAWYCRLAHGGGRGRV